MLIRPVRYEDVDAIGEILVRAWQFAYRGIIPDEVLEGLDPVTRANGIRERYDPGKLYLGAVDDKDWVIGFARATDPPRLTRFDVEIGSMYVHPRYNRAGVGSDLMRAMLKEFHREGNRTMCIETLKDNPISCGFYEKMGGKLLQETGLFWNCPTVWYGWDDLGKYC